MRLHVVTTVWSYYKIPRLFCKNCNKFSSGLYQNRVIWMRLFRLCLKIFPHHNNRVVYRIAHFNISQSCIQCQLCPSIALYSLGHLISPQHVCKYNFDAGRWPVMSIKPACKHVALLCFLWGEWADGWQLWEERSANLDFLHWSTLILSKLLTSIVFLFTICSFKNVTVSVVVLLSL